MTKEELADMLNNGDYGDEISPRQERLAKDNRLVVVFGASDDLIEFRGAIEDEQDASWEGEIFRVCRAGFSPDFDELIANNHHYGEEDFEFYFVNKHKTKGITALFDEEGYTWVYETEIPHATFEVLEDGEKYCRGIVFSLDDLPE